MFRAAVFEKPGSPLNIERVPDLEVGEGQLLVRVRKCGICGSDLHMTQGCGYTVPAGTVLGHEFTGEVVDLPASETFFKKGDVVVAMPIIGCGKCGQCLTGKPAFCNTLGFLFGGYAEYALVNARTTVHLPVSLSPADGALTEPLAVSLHGVAMARMTPGCRVLVQGAGPIGLAALFWARRSGAASVDVVEMAPPRSDIAREMGAANILSPGDIDVAADPTSQSDQTLDYDVVIECVGVPGVLAQSIASVKRGGTVVSLGNCFMPDSVVPAMAANKEVGILFPQLYSQQEFEWALAVLDQGAVEPRHMITRTVGMDDLPEAFDNLRGNPVECKVMINPAV